MSHCLARVPSCRRDGTRLPWRRGLPREQQITGRPATFLRWPNVMWRWGNNVNELLCRWQYVCGMCGSENRQRDFFLVLQVDFVKKIRVHRPRLHDFRFFACTHLLCKQTKASCFGTFVWFYGTFFGF